jgi:hypothetical protein
MKLENAASGEDSPVNGEARFHTLRLNCGIPATGSND